MKPQRDKEIKPSIINKSGNTEKKTFPQNLLPRKCSVYIQPNEFRRDFTNDVKPVKIFPEWNDKEAEIFNSEYERIITQPEGNFLIFEDPDSSNINLPHSIQSEANFNIKWLRPENYIKENLLHKEIKKRFPDVNHIKLREQIKDIYNTNLSSKKSRKNYTRKLTYRKTLSTDSNYGSNTVEESPDQESFNANKIIPKEFVELLSNSVEIKVAPTIEVEETDEAYEKRMLSYVTPIVEENKKKNIKNFQNPNANNQNSEGTNNLNQTDKNKHTTVLNNGKNQVQTIEPEVKTKLISKRCVHNDINLQDRYADYSQWVASIFQMIKDRHIVDVYVYSLYKLFFTNIDFRKYFSEDLSSEIRSARL